MNRKFYEKPSVEVLEANTEALLDTSATIPDAGWGNVKRIQHLEDDDWDEDEYELLCM